MRKNKIFALVMMLLPLAASADFDGIVEEVLGNNSELAGMRAEHLSQMMERRADNKLEATELEFERKWPNHREFGTKMAFSVSQSFDWPGAYGARRRAKKAAEAAMAMRVKELENSLQQTSRELLLQVVDANRRCRDIGEMVANIDSMHSKIHRQLELREATELDHRKVEIEAVALRQQLAEAEAARAEVLAAIAALNGGQLPAGVADLSDFPDDNIRPLAEYLAGFNPEVLAPRAEADVARLDAKAERMGLFPGFSLGYVIEREDCMTFQGFTLGVRLPQYAASPRAKAAQLRVEFLEHQAQQAQQQRDADITATYKSLEITAKLLKDYSEAFGDNYQQLLRRALDGGQMTYVEYFNELNFYLAARLEYSAQLLRYHTLLNTLNCSL